MCLDITKIYCLGEHLWYYNNAPDWCVFIYIVMWFVYILKSKIKDWYYVGSTSRLRERIIEHNNKKVFSTKANIPLRLVYYKRFELEGEARAYEKN